MKKKVLSVLLVAAMAMSMLTGCGSKPAGNDVQSAAPSETSKETEAAAETTVSAEDETLTVWCWDPNFNVYAMKQAEKAYQVDHPNFKLDIQEKVYSDIETALITAAEAGDYSTLPDIFLMQDYSFHKNATNYPGIFTALDDCGIDFSQFSMGKLADSTVDGTHYGIPFDNGATIMAIRSDMVEAAGLKVEDFKDTTWSEFMELSKKVMAANDVPMLTCSGGSEIVIEMLQSAGASPMVDGKVTLVDNAALKKGAIVNMPKLDDVEGATNYANCGGASWAVSSNCKNTDLAFDFLNATFGADVDLYDDLLVNAGAIASYLPAAQSETYNEGNEFYGGQAVYKDIVEFAGRVPGIDYGAYYSDIRSALTDAITNVVQKNADIDTEIKNAQDTVEFNIAE